MHADVQAHQLFSINYKITSLTCNFFGNKQITFLAEKRDMLAAFLQQCYFVICNLYMIFHYSSKKCLRFMQEPSRVTSRVEWKILW